MAKIDIDKILKQTRIMTGWTIPDRVWGEVCERLKNEHDIDGCTISMTDGLPSKELIRVARAEICLLIDDIFLAGSTSGGSEISQKRGHYRKCLLHRIAVCEFVHSMSIYTESSFRRPWKQIFPAWNTQHSDDTFSSIESMKARVKSWWKEYMLYKYTSCISWADYYLSSDSYSFNYSKAEWESLNASEQLERFSRVVFATKQACKYYRESLLYAPAKDFPWINKMIGNLQSTLDNLKDDPNLMELVDKKIESHYFGLLTELIRPK